MKHQYASALAIGMGAVAGLRPMTASAVIAWALKRRWIRPRDSPFARIISASASKRIAKLAISELIAALHAQSVECRTACVTCGVGGNLRSDNTRHSEATAC